MASLSNAVGTGFRGGLVEGPDGALYGMGYGGGTNGVGTVFRVTSSDGTVTKLADLDYSITGGYPQGTLTVGPDGALYGTVSYGGAFGFGTVIRVTTTGTLTKLADFTQELNGGYPRGQMVLAGDGNFYGVTEYGPNNAGGVVYRLTPAGALSVVAYAQQQYGSPTGAFGEIAGTSLRGLAVTDDGSLLGVAERDGPNGSGTIFRLSTFFPPTTGFFVTGAGGYIPAGFTEAYSTNGTLINAESSVAATRTYTITNLTSSPVTVNSVTKTGTSNIALNVSGLPVTLAPNGTHSFTMTYLSPLPDGDVTVTVASNEATTPSYQFQVHGRVSRLVKVADFTDTATMGSYPRSDLLPDGAGNFYAMTTYGAQGGGGAAIKVTPAGTITPLAALSTIGGQDLYGKFVNGPGGLLYGFTASGGPGNGGKFFSMTPAGVLTSLASIGDVGISSYGSPVLADDGNFYGLTRYGGVGAPGNIFRVTPGGVIAQVFTFNSSTGTRPTGSLIKGSDGALYGMTGEGGPNYAGTVFKFTTEGVFTKLADFDYNTTGGYPQEDLIEGSDGNFYGLATYGGTNGAGTVFKMTPAGVLTKLADFEAATTGKYPDGSLIEASDGNFYGTTSDGGAGGAGTIFCMTPAGVLTKLADFDSATTGKQPLGSLVEGIPGTLYGTASQGGVGNYGTIFKVIFGIGNQPPANSAPTDIALSANSIDENNASGATIGTLSAIDPNVADTHTFTFAGGADDGAFTITGDTLSINDSADFEAKSSYSIRIRATDSGAGNLTFEKNFTVTINDVLEPSGPLAVNDAVTTTTGTTGTTRIYPLANDGDPNVTIVSVSDGNIIIDGRSLIIPEGYTGTFTYTTSRGRTASVTVVAGTPLVAPTAWTGLLYATNGDIAGYVNLTKSATGRCTAALKVGAGSKSVMFMLNSTGEGTATIELGTLTATQEAVTKRMTFSLVSSGDTLSGSLRPAKRTATAEQQNIALASVDAAVPGGGYARAFVKADGVIVIAGVLPDGRPFTHKTRLSDNGSFALYTVVSKTQTTGIVGGEFVTANLTSTDVTGELAWVMGLQPSGVHAGGVGTTLTANGSLYTPAATLPAGAVTLTASGGNLAASLVVATTATDGLPLASVAFPSWKVSVSRAVRTGLFGAKVKDPARARAVTGGGVYLPKSNSAWGYFPGTSEGGRIQLTQP